MNLLHVLILSFIEGVTEFLPISSTGHLILVSRILNLESSNFLKTFEIVIQLGAIMAVVVLYWRKFLVSFDIYKNLLIAFLPTALIGFFVYPLVKSFLGNTQIVIWSLFLGGIFMLLFEKYSNFKEQRTENIGKYFLIGVFQSISMIPGVSRAMATIYGGRIVGMKRQEATEFSFLLAIPTMIAATVLDLYKSKDILVNSDLNMLFVGTVLSFIFALIAVRFLINFIKNHDFKIFGWYRIVLALLFWIFVR